MMKRIFDIVVSMLGIILFFPIIFLILIKIHIEFGNPVFFIQLRPGKNGKPFKMIKIRTMLNLNDNNKKPLPDAMRITKFGKFLRSTSLDELPELWNVLKGDMSIVGPRPLLMEYLPLYSKEQFGRHLCKPGITGWAQINGRNMLTWDEKFKLDLWYVNNQSFILDIKIIVKTLIKVMCREGISTDGNVTMTKFKGSHK